MTNTIFNGNLCIGTSYEELSDRNKEEYKPEYWTFVDTFPENIKEVGWLAIFNQLPTFPQDLKIAGPVAFHNIEFKETDVLPFKKSASHIDICDCYGTLDIGGIEINGTFSIYSDIDRELKIVLSEPSKFNDHIGLFAKKLSVNTTEFIDKCEISGRKLNNESEFYKMFPDLAPEEEEPNYDNLPDLDDED